jgi:hypothetical protein
LNFFSRLYSADPDDRGTLLPLTLAMFALVVVGIIAERVSEDRVREQLFDAISRATTVRFEGRTLANSDSVLAVLRTIHYVWAHHTSPADPINLELVTGSKAYSITIARDSRTLGEYWVFRSGPNRYDNPLGEEAGRITNASLETLLPWPRH